MVATADTGATRIVLSNRKTTYSLGKMRIQTSLRALRTSLVVFADTMVHKFEPG